MRKPLSQALWDLAAKLLQPFRTMCWVCNMLRGMAIGVVVGVLLTVLAFVILGGRF